MDKQAHSTSRHQTTVSTVLEDGSIVETILWKDDFSKFCVFQGNRCRIEDRLITQGGQTLVPYSAENNLVRHRVVLLPSDACAYVSKRDLLHAVQSFIHRYVDVSAVFESVAAHYVLLSWVYDAFNELPYLRVRGDFGSGKTRFLLAVGSLCYKPIFASGASTVSPLFRIMDAIQGTLVLDESDFRMSDERTEIVKILNNGIARGFPVLRSEVNGKHDFDPRAYTVYGPKIIATRGLFQDPALESRCITEDLGLRPLREDIPITLPATFHAEAHELRNKLLLYRFHERGRIGDIQAAVDTKLEPRLSQVFGPLLAMVDDETTATAVRELALAMNAQLISDRGTDVAAQILEVVHGLLAEHPDKALALSVIAARFRDQFGAEFTAPIGPRTIGQVMRKRLQLHPHKSHGTYVLPASEYGKLTRLFERYGIGAGGAHAMVPQDGGDEGNPTVPE